MKTLLTILLTLLLLSGLTGCAITGENTHGYLGSAQHRIAGFDQNAEQNADCPKNAKWEVFVDPFAVPGFLLEGAGRAVSAFRHNFGNTGDGDTAITRRENGPSPPVLASTSGPF